jgi:hypothetical protein
MTVRPLQSAWRFSRNELSGKPGAVQMLIYDVLFVARWLQSSFEKGS